jgi:hypothetical protein
VANIRSVEMETVQGQRVATVEVIADLEQSSARLQPTLHVCEMQESSEDCCAERLLDEGSAAIRYGGVAMSRNIPTRNNVNTRPGLHKFVLPDHSGPGTITASISLTPNASAWTLGTQSDILDSAAGAFPTLVISEKVLQSDQ